MLSTRIKYFIDRLCCCISLRHPFLDLSHTRKSGAASVHSSILANVFFFCKSATQVEFAGKTCGYFLWPGASDKVVQRTASYLQWRLILFSRAPRLYHPKKPSLPDFLQPSPCACADDFAVTASSYQSLILPCLRLLWWWTIWLGST